MRRAAIAAIAAMGAAAIIAEAEAGSPRIRMDHVRHMAWDLGRNFVRAHHADGARIGCKRISRSGIDCKTSVDLNAGGYETAITGREGCWDVVTTSTRVSWTMRYRARRWDMDYYFVGDREASTTPDDDAFGGLALRVRHPETHRIVCRA